MSDLQEEYITTALSEGIRNLELTFRIYQSLIAIKSEKVVKEAALKGLEGKQKQIKDLLEIANAYNFKVKRGIEWN
ncbi:hypothetical protein [Carboxydothermus pertinax]|uniref:Uncharacterized protein n=1 Tax=Carboxydothermus pertinax TaxID=870242 RepID=A0A1L8CXI5_9THEO|nr:hypothetical protein [Carboxydothermus pertinax]GAV23642.1 hypothetical protein cpu_21520 [Carboxydothermus pertinax]